MQLQVVVFVLRYQPFIAAPTVLGREISSFLGPSAHLSLSEACKVGSISLLDWMWEASCISIAERPSSWSLANFLRSDVHYYRWQFSKTLEAAATHANLATLDWVFKHFKGCIATGNIVELVAGKGHLQVLQYMLERDAGREYRHHRVPVDNESELYYSIPELPSHWSGPGNCMCWGGRSMLRAIENGHLDVARWLDDNSPHEHNDNEIKAIVHAALEAGAVEFAKSLLPADRSIFDYAENCFHPDVVEMKLNSGIQLNQTDAALAVYSLTKAGRLDLLKQLDHLHSPPPADNEPYLHCWKLAMYGAIQREDFPMIQWLVEHQFGQDVREKRDGSLGFVDVAASRGNLCILQYLRDKGFADGYEDALVRAVHNGHLDAVKWLLPHATDLTKLDDHNLMDEAAKYGHLDILQFFHNTSSPCALISRKTDAMEIIRCSPKAMDFAAAQGHLDVVQWLHANRSEGCTTFAMNNAAKNGYLEIVQWLHTNRSEGCTTEAMDSAAQEGFVETVKWLHKNRSEGCTFKAIEMAISNGHLHVACWLRTHYTEHHPAMVGKAICPGRMLEILLFLNVHYPHVFTIWFCARIRRFLLSANGANSNVVEWLDAHHPNH
ncbi:hypothetical protein F442_19811 [Phytophthora nicotianae P10297]|uniref:Uncharacterized protein n=1 Tax=Phytophthora nicotianae P10297 TaxID=1317064 RepID=W2Y9A9_PHYNI|nr:hypothetical protein F442_19811 [Phytophthora nicotianae P10297]